MCQHCATVLKVAAEEMLAPQVGTAQLPASLFSVPDGESVRGLGCTRGADSHQIAGGDDALAKVVRKVLCQVVVDGQLHAKAVAVCQQQYPGPVVSA